MAPQTLVLHIKEKSSQKKELADQLIHELPVRLSLNESDRYGENGMTMNLLLPSN